MRWWAALQRRYYEPELPPEPVARGLTLPPPVEVGRAHHCGHVDTSYATCPRTYRTRCLPCHQAQFITWSRTA